MRITGKGRVLADNAHVGDNRVVLETCSRICRAAASYLRVQEDVCNGHPANSSPTLPIETVHRLQKAWEKQTNKRNEQLSKLIAKLALTLPGAKGVNLGGDPRGCTVEIVFHDGRSNNWGRDAICVPGA